MTHIEKYAIKFFKDTFNVDLSDPLSKQFQINETVVPNFFNYKPIYFNHIEQQYENFEFARILLKIFGENFYQTNLSYYETKQAKIKKNDIVLDCGGNLGIFSAYAASKGATVYSFEPGTLIRHYLKVVQALYSDNIYIVPHGVGEIEKIATFIQYDNPAASRTEDHITPTTHDHLYQEKISIITLDSFCQKLNICPNFIKMDIEGAEIEALAGAKNIIQLYHPVLSISIHHGNEKFIQKIKTEFKDYDFTISNRQNYDIVLTGV